jgi:hypothetical protein
MKYPEGMEEDAAVRPGMPSVGPGWKDKAFPKGEPLLLEREREKWSVFRWWPNEWVWKRRESR